MWRPAVGASFSWFCQTDCSRGQITGAAIVANESALASSGRVGALVDALSSEALFTVAWSNPALKYVAGAARKTAMVLFPRGLADEIHSRRARARALRAALCSAPVTPPGTVKAPR